MRTHAIPAGVRLGLPLAATAMVLTACGSSGSSANAGAGSGSSGTQMVSTVKTTSGSHGTYLVDGSGHALYLFAKDKGGKSSCSGSCATFWPPAEVHGTPKASGSVQAADLGTFKRSDGSEQLTYNGHPLYYYSQDSSPGDTNGQGKVGFGGKWNLVSPAGTAIGGTNKASGGSSSSGGSGSGGGWG